MIDRLEIVEPTEQERRAIFGGSPSPYRELLLGCGHARDKRIFTTRGSHIDQRDDPYGWQNLVTVDQGDFCSPDVISDLDTDYRFTFQFPPTYAPPERFADACEEIDPDSVNPWWVFKDSSFDEVHAYEVLEHLGHQGMAKSFFNHFSEIWRILKPNGYLCATVPSRYSPWLWGDPSHRRLINEESLSFLDQDNYAQLDGPRPTMMSDFRHIYKADFKVIERQDNHKLFYFILQAVKPSRVRDRIA
jgi:SAM-dependent methyltransferase